ncbi:mechanosensitive ion channel domain-containing protein [Desulfopila inferna]|uniref:mechanosensitive ion channel domain-containing protein n=1 Tax=Desulfopila inferna TaxID=468528 RepID=UPI0019632603|nr:mechanosensitive ion channel domain-containing protein [Desulfopila inferna]MBM9603644.1 mechanosensitive ion channel [Desulfopila inferna]
MRSGFFISLIVGTFFFFMQPCPANAQQDPATVENEISQDSIERLLKDLEDPQKLENLRENLRILLKAEEKAQAEEPGVESGGMLGQMLSIISDNLQEVNQVLAEAGKHVLQIPSLLRELMVEARDTKTLLSWGEMAGKVVLALVAGLLAQALASRLLAGRRKALEDLDAFNNWNKILLLIGTFVLELIPIIAFAAASYGILPLLDPRPGTQLVALTLINSNVLVRLIMAFARLILVPEKPSLNFLPMRRESVYYLYIWVHRIVRTSVYGYFFLEAGLILGLPLSLYLFLLKLLGLVVAILAIILIMQNRKGVSLWLRGDQVPLEASGPSEPEAIDSEDRKTPMAGTLRRRFADFWHIGAILVVAGMFITWALEIDGGLYYVIRAIVLTVMVLALTTFFVRMSRRGIDRLFKISEELKNTYPELEERANRYLPLLRHTVRGILYLIAFFSIMQAWGLGTLSWLLTPQGGAVVSNIVFIFLIVAAAFLFWEIASVKIENYLLREREGIAGKKGNTRLLTLLPLLKNVIRITLILVAGMSVLAHVGINIAPLLAGAGVIGLAVGFGSQALVRDVISGAFILLEDSVAVGDWVDTGGHSGTVENLTIRTLTLRDLSGTVHVIPFGEVTTIQNYNRGYAYALIDAGVAYREDYGEVVQALQDVAAELRQDETWGPDITGDLEVFGMNNLGDSAVEIRVRMKTLPSRQFSVRRAFLERMKRVFDERGIEIPFPHQTIWFGVDKDGTAPPMRVTRQPKDSGPGPENIEGKMEQEPQRPDIEYTSEKQASEEVVEELDLPEKEGKKEES